MQTMKQNHESLGIRLAVAICGGTNRPFESRLEAYELKVLEAFADHNAWTLTPGAALDDARRTLTSSGLLTLGGDVTEKGMGALGWL